MNPTDFFSSHPRSIRFLAILSIGIFFLYTLKRLGLIISLFPGLTFVVVSVLFLLGYPQGAKRGYLLIAILGIALLQTLATLSIGEVASHSVWLFVLQILLFAVWTFWLFRFQPWSKDIFTVWTLSGILQLAIVPSLSFSQELIGFGSLILITLWLMVETDKIGDIPSP